MNKEAQEADIRPRWRFSPGGIWGKTAAAEVGIADKKLIMQHLSDAND